MKLPSQGSCEAKARALTNEHSKCGRGQPVQAIKSRRFAYVVASLALCLFIVQVVAQLLWTPPEQRFADLQVYVGAVNSLFRSGSLYDYERFNGDVFTYPPSAGFALSWLQATPSYFSVALWNLGTLGALVVIARSFSRGSSSGRARIVSSSAFVEATVVLLLLVATTPGRSNIAFGQLSAGIVALVSYDLLVVREKKAGWLLGLACALKLTPLLFLPMLFLAGRRAVAVRALCGFMGIGAVAWCLHPSDSRLYWLGEVSDGSRFVNGSILGNQSLLAVLQRSRVPDLNFLWVTLIVLLTSVAIVAGAALWRRSLKRESVVCIGCATVVASPISWTHHQFWLVLAVLMVMPGWRRRNHGWKLLVVAVMTLSPTGLPGLGVISWVAQNSHFLLALAIVAFTAALATRAPGPDSAQPAEARSVARPRRWRPDAIPPLTRRHSTPSTANRPA